MKYVGLQTQIWNNNLKSTILLIMFPVVILGLAWLFIYFTRPEHYTIADVNNTFTGVVPWLLGAVLLWFIIAWYANTSIIRKAAGARPLERKDNKRVYNLLENLCIATGMKMPKINIIEDDSLNAFASGINEKSYTITLSRGIINKLNDEELESVIAHELSHIRNKDVRLLIVSIIFVGIFAFLVEILLRSFFYSSMTRSRGRGSDRGRGIGMLIALALAIVGFFITTLFRFAISRKREYMADAGAAQLTKRPKALASALKKISQDSKIEAVTRKDVAQLFIDNPKEPKKDLFSFFNGLFATHPPIEKRISVLEQF
ncbi:MAG: M48 family metallopeptidase [Bacteroidales bacterium]